MQLINRVCNPVLPSSSSKGAGEKAKDSKVGLSGSVPSRYIILGLPWPVTLKK